MGLKNGVWQQLSGETGGADCYRSLREVEHESNNKYVLNFKNKSFLNDFRTFYFICKLFAYDWPSMLTTAVHNRSTISCEK
jgi:hypothetical protein